MNSNRECFNFPSRRHELLREIMLVLSCRDRYGQGSDELGLIFSQNK
jgi:hypothetical protein